MTKLPIFEHFLSVGTRDKTRVIFQAETQAKALSIESTPRGPIQKQTFWHEITF